MASPLIEARIRALDRAVRVLREEYANILKPAAEAFGICAQPAPCAHHIFRAFPLDVESVTANADTWIGLYPLTGLTTKGKPRSAIGPVYCQHMEFDIRVDLAFRQVPQRLPELYARPSGTDQSPVERRQLNVEFMALRADVYAAALVECLCRYMVREGVCFDVRPVTDIGFPVLTADQGIFGKASATVRVTLDVGIPVPQPLPSDIT